MKPKGWTKNSEQHALARLGIKTTNKDYTIGNIKGWSRDVTTSFYSSNREVLLEITNFANKDYTLYTVSYWKPTKFGETRKKIEQIFTSEEDAIEYAKSLIRGERDGMEK
jgi:hypothetical protein